MSQSVIEYSGRLVVVRCWCGISHAVPEDLRDYQLQCHDDGRKEVEVYCPLGHTYIPSGTPKHEQLERRLQFEREHSARLAAERDQARASARGYKGSATRARKRAAAALCPCCNRSFVQLRRHLASQHPEYTGEVE